VVHEDDF
jgi:hypothetical protein